ncbi:MAG: CDP-alcohol phosphatidyltransferase family protein [Bacteroidia bacterium]|nr:MAG: CDP-alcohol phosphatidyltransferase family protein [Bacteroidia bacterium]
MHLKNKITLPNILSFYRLLAFPVILFMALNQREQLFAILIIINLITDILDGFFARILGQRTKFGARLDSIADIGTYLLVFIGIWVFKRADFAPHVFSFSLFIGLLIIALGLSLIKFGRFPSLHLYSWKIGGYIQGTFFFVLFAFGFYTPFYYVMIVWGILAFIEHIIIQLMIPEMRTDAKGIFWVLKEHRR